MSILLDTSSLLILVRYYLPFDKNGELRKFIQEQINSGNFLIIDKVIDESTSVAKGIILSELSFIKAKAINTVSVLPTRTFYNLVDNQFCNKAIKRLRGIEDFEYQLERADFLESADAKLMLYAQSIRAHNPMIVTEETEALNDQKLFKKIPVCCKEINVPTCTLPELFVKHLGHNIGDFLQ